MVKRAFGALPSKTDIRDYKYQPASMGTFPEEFELKINEVKNQSDIASCVAHSACEIAETFNLMQNKNNKRFSVGFIYGKRYNYKDKGMYLRDALKTLQKIGICEYEQFPYNKEVPEIIDLFEQNINNIKDYEKNRISTYFQIDKNDENAIKKCLMENGPIMISVKWYNDFKAPKNKNYIIQSKFTGAYGNHALMLYGWNKDGWKILNSWGYAWGNSGKAIYPYTAEFNEVWGVTDTITDDIKTTPKCKVYQIIAKIVNKIMNKYKTKIDIQQGEK